MPHKLVLKRIQRLKTVETPTLCSLCFEKTAWEFSQAKIRFRRFTPYAIRSGEENSFGRLSALLVSDDPVQEMTNGRTTRHGTVGSRHIVRNQTHSDLQGG